MSDDTDDSSESTADRATEPTASERGGRFRRFLDRLDDRDVGDPEPSGDRRAAGADLSGEHDPADEPRPESGEDPDHTEMRSLVDRNAEPESSQLDSSPDRLWNQPAAETASLSDDVESQPDDEQVGGTADEWIWNSESESKSTPHEERSANDSRSERADDSPSEMDDDHEEESTGLGALGELPPGEQTLLISPIDHEITNDACSRLLGEGTEERNVLFVTVVESAAERLELCHRRTRWPGGNVAIVEVGGHSDATSDVSRTTAGATDSSVTVRRIPNPSNLSKLGITTTQLLSEWEDDDRPVVVCVHTVSALQQYVDDQLLYQFLHMLKSRLDAAGMRGHYHLNQGAHHDIFVETIAPIFDSVVRLSQQGTVEIE